MSLLGNALSAVGHFAGGVVDSAKKYFDEDQNGKVSFGEVLKRGAQVLGPGAREIQTVKNIETSRAATGATGPVTPKEVAKNYEQPLVVKAGQAATNLGAAIARAPARAITSVAISGAAPAIDLARGTKASTPEVYTPNTKLGKFLLGEDPIEGVFEKTKKASTTARNILVKAGVNEDVSTGAGLFLGPLLVGGMTGLDLTPIGGEGRAGSKIAKDIALSRDVGQITKYLDEFLGGAHRTNPALAETLSRIKNPKLVQRILEQESVYAAETLAKAAKTAENVATKAKAPPKTGEQILQEIRGKIQYTKPIEETETPLQTILRKTRDIREATVNRYTWLDDLQSKVLKSVGQTRGRKLLLSEEAERLAGLGGQQQMDQIRYNERVIAPIKNMYQNFNEYLTLRRSLARVNTKMSNAKVGSYTSSQLTGGLKALFDEVGPEKFKVIEKSANELRAMANEGIDLLVDAGIKTKAEVEKIKNAQDFYAPFKVLQDTEAQIHAAEQGGQGIKIADSDLPQRLSGIMDDEFLLQDPASVMSQRLLRLRAAAERNKVLQKVADLAKTDEAGKFIQELKPGQSIPKGMGSFSVYEDGARKTYVLPKEAARAISGMNEAQVGTLFRGISALTKPFKFGAITANAAYQTGNIPIDIFRNLTMNKYVGLKPEEILRFPINYLEGLWGALSLNIPGLNPSKLAREFLESGAAGSTIARVLDPESFVAATNASRIGKILRSPAGAVGVAQEGISRLGDIVETTSKIAGFLPGKRAVARGEATMDEVVREVRRYAGSPDFARRGTLGRHLSLLATFFNANLQGKVADLRRLSPLTNETGKLKLSKDALNSWVKLAGGMGIPATLLAIENMKPENREDYEKIPQWERDNYFMIPKSLLYGINDPRSYFTNQNGEKIRDYWKIQKREMTQLLGNVIEEGVKFAVDKDPDILTAAAQQLMEGLSPINISGRNLGERGLSVVSSLNPLIKIPAELSFGTSTFTKNPIIPDYINSVSTKDLMIEHPEDVYTKSTPQIYIDMARVLRDKFDRGVSPLYLQHAIENYTGGLARTLAPPQGRTGERESLGRVQSRFQRSAFLGQSDAEVATQDAVNKARSDYAAGRLDANKTAEVIFDALSKPHTPEEAKNLVSGMDEDVAAAFVRLVEKKANTASYTDTQIQNLPSNRAKATFVIDNINALKTQEEKAAFLQKMETLGVLTEGVVEEMKTVLSNP